MLVFWKKTLTALLLAWGHVFRISSSKHIDSYVWKGHTVRVDLMIMVLHTIYFFYCGCACLNRKQLSYHSLSTASRRPCYLAQQWIASILSSPPLPYSPLYSLDIIPLGRDGAETHSTVNALIYCIWVKLSGWSWHLADWPFHIWAYFRGMLAIDSLE